VISNGDGTSSLQLVSNTSGSAGTLAVTSSIVDATTPRPHRCLQLAGIRRGCRPVGGRRQLTSSSTRGQPHSGVTFSFWSKRQRIDGSLEQIQVVIGNDNTDVESTVNSFVSDYNSLISAMNTRKE